MADQERQPLQPDLQPLQPDVPLQPDLQPPLQPSGTLSSVARWREESIEEREGGVEKSTERLVAVKPEEKPESVQLTKSEVDVIAEKTVQMTNEEQHIIWEGYGLRLHIPHNSLPEGRSLCQLKIAVTLSGNFDLPEDGVLVSAVYSFSHDLGDKELRHPVTLEMQHCASPSALNDLCVVRAAGMSYKFEVAPGFFSRSDGYGAIKLHRFSLFSTLLRRFRSLFSRSPNHLEYCAKVYYTSIQHLSFHFELFIIRNLDALLKVTEVDIAKRDGKFEHGPLSKVQFEENKIRLDIPKDTINGWKMKRLNQLLVCREDVDRYTVGIVLIPCQVKVWWVGVGDGGKAPMPLLHEMKLIGAKEEFDFLTVTSPTLCIEPAHSSPERTSRKTRCASQFPATQTPYEAVLNSYEDITRATASTPGAKEAIFSKFKMASWIDPNADCSEYSLCDCALERIRQDPNQFPIFMKMLRDTAGMNNVADKLMK